MTRNERILEAVENIRRLLISNRKWVDVCVAPGHSAMAPFVSLSPKSIDRIEDFASQTADAVPTRRRRGKR